MRTPNRSLENRQALEYLGFDKLVEVKFLCAICVLASFSSSLQPSREAVEDFVGQVTSAPFPPADAGEDFKPGPDDGRLPDEIRFVKFSSIAWTHDDKGFFYQV